MKTEQVIISRVGSGDCGEVRSWLERNEAANNILLGALDETVGDSTPVWQSSAVAPEIWVVREALPADILAVVAAQGGHVQISGPHELSRSDSVLSLVATAMHASTWRLDASVAQQVFPAYVPIRVEFALSRSAPFGDETELHPPLSSELRVVREWMIGFCREADWSMDVDYTIRRALSMNLLKLTRNESGSPTSLVMLSRITAHGACVSAVYTPPRLRRQGHGRRIVRATVDEVIRRGHDFCVLYVDRGTPAERLYRSLGFGQVGEFRTIEGAHISEFGVSCGLELAE